MITKSLFFLINFVLAGSKFPPSSATIFANFKEKIAAGDINALQSIIEKNSNYVKSSAAKPYRNKGLILAVQKRHASVVEMLLKHGNVDVAVNKNEPIRLASANGAVDIVRLLITHPAVNPGAINNEALTMAAKHGHTEIVRVLLAHPKVDSSARNYLAIYWASELRHADIVKLLLHNGRIFPTSVTSHILERAAYFGNVDLVQYLLRYPRYSYLAHLLVNSDDLLTIRTLVEAGYKIDQDALKISLRIAKSRGNEDLVNYLELLIEYPKLPKRPLISMTEQCAICLSDENLLEGFITTCNHQFHVECLQQWFSKHNTCPICRSLFI